MQNNKHLKILHIISDLKRGGRERQLSILVNYSKGIIDNQIVTFHSAKENYLEEYKIENIHLLIGGRLSRIQNLNKLIRNEKFDLIHGWGNSETIYGMIPSFIYNIPILNGSVRHGILSKRFSHYFRMLVLHLSKNVLANSKAGLNANRLKKGYVLYNGIEEKFLLEKNPGLRNKLRMEILGIEDDIPCFISVANLVPYKDYFSVLSALKKLKDDGTGFKYIILGSGPLKDEIEVKIKEYNLENEIKLRGNVSNVNDYLLAADIFIHSSKGEGCSNAVLEAMAAGLPVIASDTGGTSEIVNKKSGFLYEYKNVNQLYEFLSSAVSDIKRLRIVGEFAQREIKNKFSVDVMVNNYVGIVKHVIKNKHFSNE